MQLYRAHSKDVFSKVTNHISPSASMRDEPGFDCCLANGSCLTKLCQV